MATGKIDTGTDHLLCEVRDGVAIITLNRPDARNALSDEMRPALARMFAERGADPDVGALLVTGAGTAFCAGGDVKRMGDKSPRATMTDEEAIAALRERQRAITGALMAVRQPTIAALPGAAAGAGLSIALACDMRIAAQSAFAAAGYARVGLSGDYGIAWLMTRAIGSARARELMLLADRIDSETALRIGLFNRVVPDGDLAEAGFDLARKLANGPRVALRHIKDNLDEAGSIDYLTALDREAERLVKSSRTADHKEAVAAFVEKRAPVFKGA